MSLETIADRALHLSQRLALEFGAPRISRATVSSLATLFPTIKYVSVGVVNAKSCVVSNSSRVQAGPCSLLLHAEGTSCLGIVSRRRSALHASLSGPGSLLLHQWTDIVELTRLSPDCTHILCVPFTPTQNIDIKGGLLLGFSSPPSLNPRRIAGVTALCQMLSIALRKTAPRVICSVETIIGTHEGCHVCLLTEDDIEDNSKGGGRECDDKDPLPPPPPPPPPTQSILIPIPEEAENDENVHFIQTNNSPPSVPFSKSAMYAAIEIKSASMNPLYLTYITNAELEWEFQTWFQHRIKPLDTIFSMFSILAILFGPLTTRMMSAGGRVNGSGSYTALSADFSNDCIPLIAFYVTSLALHLPCSISQHVIDTITHNDGLNGTSTQQEAPIHRRGKNDGTQLWRDVVVAFARISLVAIGVVGSSVVNITPALGLRLRMTWHLPVQLLTSVILLSRAVSPIQAILTLIVGFILPTAVVYKAELGARRIFEHQIQMAAIS